MGTRNLTMVILDGKPKVAQYAQWDGYPSGQGVTALNFLKKNNLEKFKERLKDVRFANKKDTEERENFSKEIGINDGWMNSDQATKYNKKFPYDSRDHGAEILQMIMDSEGTVVLQDSSDFAADSLFCEWAYVIDLDKNTLEVYKGFNKTPLKEKERFAYLQDKNRVDYTGDPYYPVKFVKSYNLKRLPSVKKFIGDLETDENDY